MFRQFKQTQLSPGRRAAPERRLTAALRWLQSALLLVLFIGLAAPGPAAHAQEENQVGTWDLIAMINQGRATRGYRQLEVSNILMSTAQSTAEIMAASKMGWHIGDVRGRVMAAGYGGGAIAWATENFAIGPMTLEEIAWIWSDASHMIPIVNPSYQHIGAGIATAADGSVYYVVHAAYTGGGVLPTRTPQANGTPGSGPTATEGVIQWVMPVVTATPNSDGSIIHDVLYGQSLWSIAIAYNTKIIEILRTNNLAPENQLIYTGQKLVIPVTPAAIPATLTATPGAESDPRPELTPSPQAVAARPSSPTMPPARPTLTAAQVINTPTLAAPAAKTAANVPLVWTLLAVTFILGVALIVFGLITRRQ